jgi:hypothetical protein
MAAFEIDPGTAKMVLLFGGAGVVAIIGLWRTMAAGREFERQRLAREAEARESGANEAETREAETRRPQ